MVYKTNLYIERSQKPETFALSPELVEHLGLDKHQALTLHFGSWTIGGNWRLMDKGEGQDRHGLKINEPNLPNLPPTKINVKSLSQNHIAIGPVIGVFLSNGHIRRIKEGEPNFRNLELALANDVANTFLYFFSINDFRWVNNRVEGCMYIDGKWQIVSCPLPDVLYDRAGGFLNFQLPVAKYIRTQLDFMPHLKKVNASHHFSKHDVNQRLDKYSELSSHIPHTILYASPRDLWEMVEKYNTVYVKTFFGNNGLEVMRIRQLAGAYEYSYIGENPILEKVPTKEDVVAEIDKFLKRKKSIVQQGVDVVEYEGGNVDLRVLVQKGIDGKWRVTDIPVRIGNADCAVTSTRTGARVFEFMDIIPVIFNCGVIRARKIYEEVSAVALKVTQRVVEEYGDYGEVGIDIALDKKQNIWFIEVNAKPGKDTVYLSGNKKSIQEAFLQPLEYCLFLTGFSRGGTNEWK